MTINISQAKINFCKYINAYRAPSKTDFCTGQLSNLPEIKNKKIKKNKEKINQSSIDFLSCSHQL